MLFSLLIALSFSRGAPAEAPVHEVQATEWLEQAKLYYAAVNGGDEDPNFRRLQFETREARPLRFFPHIRLHEVHMQRPGNPPPYLGSYKLDPLRIFAHGPHDDFRESLVEIIQDIDIATYELLKEKVGHLPPENFYAHPLVLHIFNWLIRTAYRPLRHRDVFLVQAALTFTDLLADRTHITMRGTHWALLDAALGLRKTILAHHPGGPGQGDLSSDRDQLSRAFADLSTAIRQALPVYEHKRLCAIHLELAE